MAADASLLAELLTDDPSDAELAASLEQIDRSMENVRAGNVRPIEDAMRDIAKDLQFTANTRE